MIEAFIKTINTFPKKGKKLRVLVAASAGVDSTVLAHLCQHAELDFALAHCNFNLRGEESDQDQEFVEQMAKEMKVPVFIQSFATMDEAQSKSKSIQLTARELRYDWFKKIIVENGFDYLFAAHHLNDRVETALFNFLRGTGVAGLRSIKIINDYIARPLIDFTREDIKFYATINGLKWREDSSNKSNKYARNYLRNKVIPLFDGAVENWEKSINKSFNRLEQLDYLVNQMVSETSLLLANEKIDCQKLRMICKQPIVLEKALKPFGFNYTQAENIFSFLTSTAEAKTFASVGYKIIIDRGTFYLKKKEAEEMGTLEIKTPGEEVSGNGFHLATSVVPKEDFEFVKGNNNAYFDLNKVSFPIKVDFWKEGDSFVPFGMKGKKKVSDLFIDLKIPVHHKPKIPILKDANGKILWVAGLRQTDHFKISSTTQNVLILHLI